MTQYSPPRGTQDVLPADWRLRHRVLDAARQRFEAAGYGRISTPTFEHSELFHRGVGEATDIVAKETYDFEDRGGRRLTLRPEGTAGVARSYVTHGLHREPLPVKLWYSASMFRYEKPQAGRVREHEQLGCEAFGSEHPAVDAELICLLDGLYRDLGVPGVSLRLNTIGSGEARRSYREALVAYLEPRAAELDADSRERLSTNPLRILDSKDPGTREVLGGAPELHGYLEPADREHFAMVRAMLDAAGVDYAVDQQLVRGLDYYTRTVFEFQCDRLGAQSTIGGGGRYDGLVEALGGPATPAVGFGSGIERIVLALGSEEGHEADRQVDAYVGVQPDAGGSAWTRAFRLTVALRERGRSVELDLAGRSPKGQAKQSARLGAPLRVLVDDLGARMFLRGDFDGVDLPADVDATIGQVDAQLASAGVAGSSAR